MKRDDARTEIVRRAQGSSARMVFYLLALSFLVNVYFISDAMQRDSLLELDAKCAR